MIKIKPHILLSVAIVLSVVQCLATDYVVLSNKAQNFYERKEWASVQAMYELMLEQKPTEAKSYGRAVVASVMLGDTIAQERLLNQSIENQVPFDSLFSTVRQEALQLGSGEVYVQFMMFVKNRCAWLTRTVNAQLLEYYTFRNNGVKMIEFSKMMLDGAKQNENFLHTLAQGYMLNAQMDKSIATYKEILEINPDNYIALVELGNYYTMMWDKNNTQTDLRNEALKYLLRAYEIKATPYLESTIKRLQAK